MIGFISSPDPKISSAELLENASKSGKIIYAFKHCSSNESAYICGKNKISIPSISVKHPMEIFSKITNKSPKECIIIIDEIERFSIDLIDVCLELSFAGYTILCAGLIQDWRSIPYRTSSEMAVISDQIMKIYSRCSFCGNSEASKNIEIDENEKSEYMPACNKCYKNILDRNNIDYIGKFPRYLKSIPIISNEILD